MKALDKKFFWDVDRKTLNYVKHADFIIRRVLGMGDLKDYRFIKKKYGVRKIKKVAQNTLWADSKTQNFWRLIFNIKQNKWKSKLSQKKRNPFWSR